VAKSTTIDVEAIRRLYEYIVKKFPTEADCLTYLVSVLIGTVVCKYCGSKRLHRSGNDRHARCLDCKKKSGITARTFLGGVKRPTAYLMALMCRGYGVAINGAELARVSGVAPSTGQCILKKIDTVIASEMAAVGILLKSRAFSQCVLKRSSHTPAKQRIVAEFDEIEKQNSRRNKSRPGLKLSPDEKLIYKLLSKKPISFDSLVQASGLASGATTGVLMLLELAGLAQGLPGDYYLQCPQSSAPQKLSQQTISAIDKNVQLIRATYHGISRRYLQCYLGFAWSMLDRAKWNFRALLRACGKFGLMTNAEIADYVSPPMVLIAP
jgi:DprA winged helix domain